MSFKNQQPVVACLPLYPPLELLHSFGLRPVILWDLTTSLKRADAHLQRFCCAVGRKIQETVLSHGDSFSAYLHYNACDTLRNLPEILQAGRGQRLDFLRFHLPMILDESPTREAFLDGEIRGLISQLEATFKRTFDPQSFVRSTAVYARRRALCREVDALVAKGQISFADFAATMGQGLLMGVEDHITLLENLRETATLPQTGFACLLSGILPPAKEILVTLEQAGLRVVGNDLASMGRSYYVDVPPSDDPVSYYREFYFHHVPCPTLHYTVNRRQRFLEELKERGSAKALIFFGQKYCEYEYFDWPWLQAKVKEIGLRSLALEISADGCGSLAATKTRLEAFAESLESSSHD